MWDYSNAAINKYNNWSSELKVIFQNADVNNFSPRSVCNLHTIKMKLCTTDAVKWQDDISQKPKLRTYIKFKSSLETEPYVKSYIPKSQRSTFAKIRCGILQLRIESGRYNNINVEDRICELCSLNEIEDEQHFVCSCTLYSVLREELYAKIVETDDDFIQLPQDEKFVYLMKKKQKLLSKFVYEAFTIRCQKIYEL